MVDVEVDEEACAGGGRVDDAADALGSGVVGNETEGVRPKEDKPGIEGGWPLPAMAAMGLNRPMFMLGYT